MRTQRNKRKNPRKRCWQLPLIDQRIRVVLCVHHLTLQPKHNRTLSQSKRKAQKRRRRGGMRQSCPLWLISQVWGSPRIRDRIMVEVCKPDTSLSRQLVRWRVVTNSIHLLMSRYLPPPNRFTRHPLLSSLVKFRQLVKIPFLERRVQKAHLPKTQPPSQQL